jgi:hypothetical protein
MEGVFGERAASVERNSLDMSKEKGPAVQRLLLNETDAQNRAAK